MLIRFNKKYKHVVLFIIHFIYLVYESYIYIKLNKSTCIPNTMATSRPRPNIFFIT